MQMTWGEIKSHCINLGFSKMTEYKKDPSRFVDAANRAITQIATTVKPIIKSIVIPHYPTPNDPDYISYNMKELAENFWDFADECPSKDGIYPIVYRKIEPDIILFPKNISGDITVWYKKLPEKISQETPDSYPLELAYEAAMLVPTLMGFYVWMDDDPRMAVMFRNDFEEQSTALKLNTSQHPITIKPGKVI